MRIAWHAIVRNESAIIERCAASLLPHVDCAVVVDTGSTDDTIERLTRMFIAAEKPLMVGQVPFKNFAQARNEALEIARSGALEWDYLLLADADMELRVDDPHWINGHAGQAYDLKQTAGSVSYFNRRLLHRAAAAEYKGPTHEYLDVVSAGVLDGAYFVDHADGSNRPEKLQRDIALLTSALSTETDPGLIARYTFYLAQSYFDAGDWTNAGAHYQKRATLGGYAEEAWNAQLHYAHCLGNQGNHAGFVHEMLKAYEMRPSRAETLYDLAKYYRERGENRTSLVFSTAGCAVPYPKDDALFVNDYVYRIGLDEECSICAYYDPLRRAEGARVCDRIALDRNAPAHAREQARANLYWYLSPLKDCIPSFHATQLRFDAPEPYVFTNPSVASLRDDTPLVLLRAVNYRITPEGRYDIRDGGTAIRTRNFLLDTSETSRDLLTEIEWHRSFPGFYDQVVGLEDCRLFWYGGKLRVVATARECNLEGQCQMVLGTLVDGEIVDWSVLHSPHHEKNWMPWVQDGELRFVYRLGTLVDANGKVVFLETPDFDVSRISGGSQVVKIDDQTWLAVVHEAGTIPDRPHNRYYQHRFVRFRPTGQVDRISPAFFFHDRQIEFAAGLGYFPHKKQLMVSFGVRDCEAWLATMDVDEVLGFISS